MLVVNVRLNQKNPNTYIDIYIDISNSLLD